MATLASYLCFVFNQSLAYLDKKTVVSWQVAVCYFAIAT